MSAAGILIGPFIHFGFMRRALVATLALAVGSGPVGTLLILRRMSLMGDALGHALLPGVAVAFVFAGLSLPAMSLGALVAGLLVSAGSAMVTRYTPLREDASFAAFYLLALAAGVCAISLHGSTVDLLHILFGTILGIDDASLILVASVATVTLVAVALAYRPLILECLDPEFLSVAGGSPGLTHALLLGLVVLNLVAGFQALGTLMAVGLMMIPAAAARFWTGQLWSLAACSSLLAAISGYAGLILSFYAGAPSGPAIVLAAGVLWAVSILVGPQGGMLWQATPEKKGKWGGF